MRSFSWPHCSTPPVSPAWKRSDDRMMSLMRRMRSSVEMAHVSAQNAHDFSISRKSSSVFTCFMKWKSCSSSLLRASSDFSRLNCVALRRDSAMMACCSLASVVRSRRCFNPAFASANARISASVVVMASAVMVCFSL